MDIKAIKTEEEYKKAIKYMESLFNKGFSEDESDKVEVLSILIEDYERKQIIESEPEESLTLDYIYDLVEKVSAVEKKGTISDKCLKLNEEVGELSAEILKIVGYKYTTDTKEAASKKALSEGSDSLIMIFDVLIDLGFSKQEIIEASEKGIEKWLHQIHNK